MEKRHLYSFAAVAFLLESSSCLSILGKRTDLIYITNIITQCSGGRQDNSHTEERDRNLGSCRGGPQVCLSATLVGPNLLGLMNRFGETCKDVYYLIAVSLWRVARGRPL